MSSMRSFLGSMYPIIIFFILNLIILSLSRIGLGLWQSERVNAVDGWGQLLLQGVRIDVSSLCWLFSVPIVAAFFLPVIMRSAMSR